MVPVPLCVPLATFVEFCNSLAGYAPQLRPDPNPPCDFSDGDTPIPRKSKKKSLELIDQTNLLLSTGLKPPSSASSTISTTTTTTAKSTTTKKKKKRKAEAAPCFRNAPLSMFTGTPNKARGIMHRIMVANGYHYQALKQQPPSPTELMMYPPTNTLSTVRTGLESLSAAVQLKDCVHLTNEEKRNRVQARHTKQPHNKTDNNSNL